MYPQIREGKYRSNHKDHPTTPRPDRPPSQMVQHKSTMPDKVASMHGERPLILALDFDGTITGVPFGKFNMEIEPAEGAHEVINEFYNDGCAIIIWTCRDNGNLKQALDYLHKWDLPYHVVNDDIGFTKHEWESCRKVYADFYIDDLGIMGFPGWYETKKIVQAHPLYGRYKNAAV